DLETICLKAIEKDPDRRYQTAGAFAEDLRRYVNRYAISAKRIGPLGRLAKFARRHKLPVAAAAAVLVMASIAGMLLWKWRTAEKVARGQRQQRQELQRQVEAERYLWEAQRLHAGGRYNDAVSKIELALQRRPALLEARLLHARLLVEMDRGAEAAAELEPLATENPDEGAVHYLLARLYRDADPRKADHHRRLAEKLLPETADACHLRAIAAGTLKETVRWLSEGLELHPRHYPSLRARAFTYYALRDYAKMETDAGSLILLRPEDPLGHALRAVARRESGRLEDALRDHDRAIQLAADDPELYAQRRETHLRKADFERALADARRCVELRPEQPTYRYHVFAELAALGRYEAAKEEYEKIAADGPQAEERFFTWATEYVFDALATGHQVSLPEETFGGHMLAGMHRTIDYYNRLAAKARRAVAEGFNASWSPDGSELAYGRGRPGSNGIEILHLESGKTRLLTVPGKDPVWSPDGRYIAFVREPQTRQIAGLDSQREVPFPSGYMHQEEIWIVTPSGEEARRLARGGFPSWSGDSKRVYFHSRHDKAIYRIAVDDPAAVLTRIMASPSSYPVVSPDEQYVACARGSVLLVDELPSGKRVARWTAPGVELGMLLRWSPDGQELSMGGYNESRLGLWIYDLGTQEARKIFDGPTTLGVWSPDRSRFAFDLRVPCWEIWVADLDPKVPTTEALGPAQTVRQHLQDLADRCDRYIQAEPDNPRGYRARSTAYWYLEEYEKAAADYRRAAELDPALLGPMPPNGPSLFVAAIPDRPPPGHSMFVLGGGPDADTPLLVDDDLELYVDGTLVFRDGDKLWTFFPGHTWGGQPISFLAKPASKVRIRVLDYGDRAAVGHVHLHHPELGSRQLLTGRSQETPVAPSSRTTDAEDNVNGQNQEPPAQGPFVLVDETFDLAEVFAVRRD
ncbi:MAG: tetratricopeptide repeat protein, partial [Planctomycetota bacterium]